MYNNKNKKFIGQQFGFAITGINYDLKYIQIEIIIIFHNIILFLII